MRKTALIAIAVVVTGGILFGWVQRGQAPQSQPELISRKGVRLEDLVKSRRKNEPVTIQKDQSPPSGIEPSPGVGVLEWWTSLAPLVFIVKVDRMQPALTANGDWIETTVTASVEEVIKKPADEPLALHDRVEFVQDGGELIITGVPVRAVLPWAAHFEHGQRYLLFTYKPTGNKFFVSAQSTFKIDDNDLLQPLANKGVAHREAGVTKQAATQRIRSAKENK